jgi:hypothetical protein
MDHLLEADLILSCLSSSAMAGKARGAFKNRSGTNHAQLPLA